MLSRIFSSLSRLFFHIEKFGTEGFKLWKSKQNKNGKIVGYKLKGIKSKLFLRTGSSDYEVFKQIFLENQYDVKYKAPPGVIVDCGANIGLASIYFANKYPSAKIIAIEPEKDNFELLKLNTGEYTNIIPVNNGIWNKKANLEIIDNGEGSWGFMTNEVEYTNDTTIAALSLNDIMNMYDLNTIDLLKIDIEGAEKEVFEENYDNWLIKTKMIIIELHDRMKKGTAKSFFNAIKSFDFKMYIQGENIICDLNSDSLL